MKICSRLFVVSALLLAPVVAQEGGYDNSPAKELQRFAPLIGNWAGGGTMKDPTGAEAKWEAHGSYRWCLSKHFVQEDFVVKFDGDAVPMAFRTYLGWDRENGRYVQLLCSNEGVTELNELQFLPDGTMLAMLTRHAEGQPYIERARTKVTGDSMAMAVDLMMGEGASMTVIDSKMARCEKAFEGDWKLGGWRGAKPNEAFQKLGSLAGDYVVSGDMVMAPGMPSVKITGTDKYEMLWGGNVMHARTDGFADGSPDAYVSHAFWGWHAHRKCMLVVWVDNMGQVGEMETRWAAGQLISMSAGLQMGQPTTQRFVVTLDKDGALAGGVGHTCMGAIDPFVSFRATYKKK